MAIAIGSLAMSIAAPTEGAGAQRDIWKSGIYVAPDDTFRVAIPAGLGEGRWMREYYSVTGQREVQFGDDQCRRYYVKSFSGPVGRAISEDYLARGHETALRNAVAQLAAQRRERVASVTVRTSAFGPAVVATSMTDRGWPCVAPFPEGGSTVSVAWYFVHAGSLYEAGYQAGQSPGDDASQSQATAGERADAFVLGLEMLGTAEKPRFAFSAGDPPPRLAGLTLGDTRAAVEKVVGPIESAGGTWEFEDKKRGLSVHGSDGKGVESVGISRREDGDVAGVRVGDRMEDVVAKWGPSAEGGTVGPDMAMHEYPAGSWALTVITHKNRVAYLGLGPYTAPRESVPDAWPPTNGTTVPPETRRVAKLPSQGDIHVGQRYELPAGSLETNTGDSVYQDDPRIAVNIADVVASPPVLPGSSSAADALGRLLGSDPVTLEIVGVHTMGDFARSIDARVSAGGRDVASAMVRDGLAIAVKGRNSDPALLSLEAQSRTARRGLWGIDPAELGGVSPEDYLRQYLSISIVPETYWKIGATASPLPPLKTAVLPRDREEPAKAGEASLRAVLAGDGAGLLGQVTDGHYTAADGGFRIRIPALDAPDAKVWDRLVGEYCSVGFGSDALEVRIIVSRGPKYDKKLRNRLTFHSVPGGDVEADDLKTRYGPGLLARSQGVARFCTQMDGPPEQPWNASGCEDYPQYLVTFIGRFGDDDYYVSVEHTDVRHPDRPHPHLVDGVPLEEAARALFDSIELAGAQR
jgi:hypothetical protein